MLPIIIIPALLATGLSLFILLADVNNVSASQHNSNISALISQVTRTQEPAALMVQPLAMGSHLSVGSNQESLSAYSASAKQTTEQKVIFRSVDSRVIRKGVYVLA